jgi:uncharacterized protein YodC (DUF2158 family)
VRKELLAQPLGYADSTPMSKRPRWACAACGSFVLPYILLMANKFKLGDVVQLKSGGPKMTVNRLLGADNQLLGCSWFLGTFNPDAVELAPKEKAAVGENEFE